MISPFLLQNAYPLLIPLALLEGPLLALVCGVAVSFGYLNPFLVWIILVGGDILPDLMYYWIGKWGATLESVRRFATRAKLIRDNLPRLEALWRERFLPTLLFAKLSYCFAPPLIVSAGLSGVPLRRFIMHSLLISTLYLASLELLGFGIGKSVGYVRGMFGNVPIALGIASACLLVFIAIALVVRRGLPLEDKPPSNIIDRR